MDRIREFGLDNSSIIELIYTLIQRLEEYCKNYSISKEVRAIFEDLKTIINVKLHKTLIMNSVL